MILKPHIRFAKSGDLEKVIAIYNQAIRSHSATDDIDELIVNEQNQWFKNFNRDSYPLYIAELQKEIVGYAHLSPYRTDRGLMHHIAEVSFYIDYDHHQKGVGSSLISYILDDCYRLDKETLVAILLDTNFASMRLLEKYQFQKWGHLPEIIKLNKQRCGQFVYGLTLE